MRQRARCVDVLVLACAIALGSAATVAVMAADAGTQQPKRVSDRPKVHKSSKTVKSSDMPGHRGPRVKAAKDVARIICEGGQVKTASNGVRGCSCGLNVKRTLVGKNHFVCERDRPQVRKSTVTKSSADLPGHKGPRAKATKQAAGPGKPVGGGKSASPGKPVKQCGDTISVTRVAAVTRIGGKRTAEAGWAIAVKKRYPSGWGNWNNAKDRTSSCKFAGTWNCTASARPCAP